MASALDVIRSNPVRWVEVTFGEEVVGKQADILRALAVPGVEEIHVPSCHASGKTHTCSRCVAWWLNAWPGDSIVVTTAPTWYQVEHLLWREIRDGLARSKVDLGGRPLSTMWELAPKWYAIGIATSPGTAVNIQGFHASHVLVIVDEADGVPIEIWQAVDSLATTRHVVVLAIGNPVNPQSAWKKRVDGAAGDPKARIIRIAADDVLPLTDTGKYGFLLQRAWVEKIRRKYGETSAYYVSRVLAKWPDEGADTLIPITWIERAKGLAVPRGPRGLGVDVARFGAARTVRTLLEGGYLVRQWVTAKQDTMQTAGHVHVDVDEHAPIAVVVDDTGIGGGVTDRLRQLGRKVIAENFGAVAQDGERFANRGSEIYWWVREALEQRLIGFSTEDPDGVEELIADLNRPKYDTDAQGRIRVDKYGLDRGRTVRSLSDEERTSRSPDRGDSLVLAYSGIRHLLPSTKLRPPTERELEIAEILREQREGGEESGWVN